MLTALWLAAALPANPADFATSYLRCRAQLFAHSAGDVTTRDWIGPARFDSGSDLFPAMAVVPARVNGDDSFILVSEQGTYVARIRAGWHTPSGVELELRLPEDFAPDVRHWRVTVREIDRRWYFANDVTSDGARSSAAAEKIDAGKVWSSTVVDVLVADTVRRLGGVYEAFWQRKTHSQAQPREYLDRIATCEAITDPRIASAAAAERAKFTGPPPQAQMITPPAARPPTALAPPPAAARATATRSDAPSTHAAVDYAFSDWRDRTSSLSALRGRVVLVHFFASWCRPCNLEMPSFIELRDRELRGRPVHTILVSTDKTWDDVRLVFDQRLPDEVYLAAPRQPPRALSVATVPATYVLSSSGDIVATFKGAQDWQDKAVMQRLLDSLRDAAER
jgi:thiol-disulfide isomerase/thioredoxin